MFSTSDIAAARREIADRIIETPVLPLKSDRWRNILPKGCNGALKLELFQQGGSFKARGAWLGISRLDPEQKAAGVAAGFSGAPLYARLNYRGV